MFILEGSVSTPVCAKLCARESWWDVNKAALISWELTVLSKELSYSLMKVLQRWVVGSPAREAVRDNVQSFQTEDSLSLARRWEAMV